MKLEEIKETLEGKPVTEQLSILSELFAGETVFTTSFGIEDQVISHLIFSGGINIDVVTLDTGRLFPETYKVFSSTLIRYGSKIKVFFPEAAQVEELVSGKGPYSFYASRENRLECCRIRKTLPLNRALSGHKCWISGIRADQSENRGKMSSIEYDEHRKIYKFYPLFDWTYGQVEDFVRSNNVPYNVLHDRGFISIGCEPCTRAVEKGADFRSGRWWWESGSEKECGLHTK